MRETIHLVSGRDYWPFAVGIRRRRPSTGELRVDRHTRARDRGQRSALASFARRLDATRGRDAMLARSTRARGRNSRRASGVDLVRVPPSGTWERRRAHTLRARRGLARPVSTATEARRLEHLARRYLGAFGPARPRHDLAELGRRARAVLRRALERLRPAPLPRRGRKRAPRPPARAAARPGHACTRPVPPDVGRDAARPRAPHRDPPREVPARIFHTKTPHSFRDLPRGRRRSPGTWRYEDGRVQVEPFGAPATRVRAELDAEADRLAAFHA